MNHQDSRKQKALNQELAGLGDQANLKKPKNKSQEPLSQNHKVEMTLEEELGTDSSKHSPQNNHNHLDFKMIKNQQLKKMDGNSLAVVEEKESERVELQIILIINYIILIYLT